jgi:N-acetylneuraminic acid mutarotase
MKKTLLFVFLFGCLTSFSQQNTWTKKASFGGLKRARGIAFAIGDYGYAGMGEDTVEMTNNDLWRYDPVFDVWSQMMTLPASTRRNASATTIGDKGYVGMGADSSVAFMGTIRDDWWEYDPVANGWTQKANYPGGYDVLNNTGLQGIYFATAFNIGTKGYVCGGKMGSDSYGTDLWEYDPVLDSWTRLADFPGGDRYQMSSFGVEGKGYVGMGIDHDLYRKDWWQYDPNLDSWTEVSSLPGTERGSSASFVLSSRAYIVFGSDGGYKDELWEYNPFTDSWNIKANFPADGRKNGFAFSIGNKGYAGTGKGASGKRKSFWEYSPLLPVSIDEFENSISVYPNPAKENINVNIDISGLNNIILLDLTGRAVFAEATSKSSFQINSENFASGTYILSIENKENSLLRTTKKITIL